MPPDLASVRAMLWARRAAMGRSSRRGADIPAPPSLPEDAIGGVLAALRLGRHTCLAEAEVLQMWHAAHGRERDLLIGVIPPARGFRAHAWLEGDASPELDGFVVLQRRSAPHLRAGQDGPDPVHRDAVVAAAKGMALDQVTAKVVQALEAVGIPSLLLKGRSFADWLYPDGGRSYGDVDLLVPPSQARAAEDVLVALGFRPMLGKPRTVAPARAFGLATAGQTAVVDLHRTLKHVPAPPERVWEVLSRDATHTTIAGAPIAHLGTAGRAFHVALHAVQHGPTELKPIEDLRRAVAVVPMAQWRETAELAAELGAEDCLAEGLRLAPEGVAVADQLGLTEPVRAAVRLTSTSADGGAVVLQRLADAGSLRERIALVHDVVVPPPAMMRIVSPLARRGAVGLGLAYAARPLRLAARVVPALNSRRRTLTGS